MVPKAWSIIFFLQELGKKPHNLKKLGPHYFIDSEITYETSYENK